MKFSGHETFQLREGWLHKGMKLINESPDLMSSEFLADHLGVGRNMAKSIRHWLVVTGLAEPSQSDTGNKRPVLRFTEFGDQVWEFDPYFLEMGTLWLLHTNVVQNFESATTWSWFFNSFSHERFDRPVCLESLRRYLQMTMKRPPSAATLERDLGCFFNSYARTIPALVVDPEEGADCPFRDLGLLNFFKSSSYFQVNRNTKDIPAEILGYAIAGAFDDLTNNQKSVDISISDVARRAGGPGRVFCLSNESTFEVVSKIESTHQDDISIAGLAGERVVRVFCRPKLEWSRQFFLNVAEGSHVIA